MTGEPGGSADRARFEHLYADTRVAILGYLLRRCSDPVDAADLLAETYLIAWRRIQDVPHTDQARLWLYGVARRTLANHHRHRQVERRLADTLRAQLADSLDRSPVRADSGLDDAITDGIAALSAGDREIIELSVHDELRPAEIAVILSTTPGAVRVRLHRIRSALRRDLLRAGYAAPRGLPQGRLGSTSPAASIPPTELELPVVGQEAITRG